MKKTLGTMAVIMVAAFLTGTFITAKCALAGEIGRDGRFIAYDTGTVLDTRTNLLWSAKDNGSNVNWAQAKSYCENFRGSGYTDWRMPTQNELAGLYDGSVKGHNGWKLTTLITLTGCCPLASEVRNSGISATSFSFDNGERFWTPTSVGRYRALPVRSGK
jgi:hypothetical protein